MLRCAGMNDVRCENCKHITMLKHNFRVGNGFEEAFCCTLFAKEKDGFVIQVELSDVCEMYEKGGDDNA